MAFALILAGIIMIVAAVRNQQDVLVCLVRNDFTGQGNFLYWVIAFLVLGAIGYVPKLKPLSDSLIVLVVLALFLTSGKQGIFKNFQAAIGSGNVGIPAGTPQTVNMPSTGTVGASQSAA
jgi:hypothetical protein